jgi:hypothetical protein
VLRNKYKKHRINKHNISNKMHQSNLHIDYKQRRHAFHVRVDIGPFFRNVHRAGEIVDTTVAPYKADDVCKCVYICKSYTEGKATEKEKGVERKDKNTYGKKI